MNKLFSLLSVLSVALLVPSCKEKPAPEPTPTGPSEITIQAATFQYSSEASTRAYATKPHGFITHWGRNEEINVFYNETSSRFVSQNNEDAIVASFSGTLDLGGKSFEDDDVSFWGLYPYDPNALFDGQSVSTIVPDIQYGSSCVLLGIPYRYLMTKGNDGISLYFGDVLSYISFSFSKGGVINKITFEGHEGEIIAGKINVAPPSEYLPIIKEVKEGKTIITVRPKDGEFFEANKTYRIAIIPGSEKIKDEYTLSLFGSDNRTYKIIKATSSSRLGGYGSLLPGQGFEIPLINVEELD